MPLQKNDFIEIEFTGKIKYGDVFDSNKEEQLKKLNPNQKAEPFIFPLGQEMFLKGIENFLIGKEIGNYEIELSPKEAFGLRDSSLVQVVPMKVFVQHKINPVPGTVLNFDNRIGKVMTVSGGRVMIDFNNPLAGKDVIYNIKIIRKVDDLNEKIKSINKFLFRRDFKYEVKDKKLILDVEEGFKSFVELFKDKFKEILNLELEVKQPLKPIPNTSIQPNTNNFDSKTEQTKEPEEDETPSDSPENLEQE